MKPQEGDGRSNIGVSTHEVKSRDASEPELLERCRRGDTRAFQTLVERAQDAAYRLALRILRSAPEAEEVAQDAFVRAWMAIRDFRGECAFATWIHRIVVRKALDRAAAMRARRSRESPIEDASEPTESGTDRERPARRLLARLLGGLPDAQRTSLTLYYFEDLPVSEIARMLGQPEGTVKTNLSRGRATLRREWVWHAGARPVEPEGSHAL